jgi:hypothetical protein
MGLLPIVVHKHCNCIKALNVWQTCDGFFVNYLPQTVIAQTPGLSHRMHGVSGCKVLCYVTQKSNLRVRDLHKTKQCRSILLSWLTYVLKWTLFDYDWSVALYYAGT